MKRLRSAMRWGAIAAGMVMPVLAHHSFAMFDQTKVVSLKGTITEFRWTNPHAFIHIDVAQPDGKAVPWDIELNSPNNLKRQGWKPTSLKNGDKVVLMTNPLRDTTKNGGLFVGVTLPDGTVLGDVSGTPRPINVPILP